jgi:hypothetical protein
MPYAPLLFISAKTGLRIDQVLPLALRVQEERLVRLPTSKVNRILIEAQDRQAPPARAGRQLKVFYGTQVRSEPPTFLIYVNDPRAPSATGASENRLHKVRLPGDADWIGQGRRENRPRAAKSAGTGTNSRGKKGVNGSVHCTFRLRQTVEQELSGHGRPTTR